MLINYFKYCVYFWALTCLYPAILLAQGQLKVQVITNAISTEEQNFWKHTNQKYSEKDSIGVVNLAKQIQNKAINKGFVESSYSLLKQDSLNFELQFKLGTPYK